MQPGTLSHNWMQPLVWNSKNSRNDIHVDDLENRYQVYSAVEF